MKDFKSPLVTDHPDLDSAISLLEGWLEQKMFEQRLPGLSIGLVYDQDLLWARGFGYNDVARQIPAQADTLYRIASITKLFTSIGIMQLRDAGKLRLDDPITNYLPWFKIRHRFPDAPAITVRHLLTHTSGLPRDSETPMWTETVFPVREAMIAALADRETALPVETRWKYSNLAFALAGEIIVAVSGEEYGAYIHRHILEPLGMTSTSVIPKEDPTGRLSNGYGRPDKNGRREMSPFMNANGFNPAFSMASSVEDLARFVSLQFRYDQPAGGPVLRGSTIKEMHRVQWLEEDWINGWGLGFSVRRIGSKVFVGHGGGAPGHSTMIHLCPADKFGLIVLTNVVAGDPIIYVQPAADILMPATLKALAKPEKTPDFNPEWRKYLGRYENRWGEAIVGIQNNRLVVQSITYPTLPAGVLIPEGEHTFRMEKGGNDGEQVVFEVDSAGKVIRMTEAGEYLLRVE